MDTATETPQNAAEEAMARAGEPLTVAVQDDYFGFEERHTFLFPDGVSFVEHSALNEGAKRAYLNQTNREITLRKQSGDANVKMAPGDDRHALLVAAITGWNLMRGGMQVPFSAKNLEDFLKGANPKLIDGLEKEIRLANPWLLAEMTVEDIEKEIAELEELKAKKIEEEAGKAASS